jgi:hypothetical protein
LGTHGNIETYVNFGDETIVNNVLEWVLQRRKLVAE